MRISNSMLDHEQAELAWRLLQALLRAGLDPQIIPDICHCPRLATTAALAVQTAIWSRYYETQNFDY